MQNKAVGCRRTRNCSRPRHRLGLPHLAGNGGRLTARTPLAAVAWCTAESPGCFGASIWSRMELCHHHQPLPPRHDLGFPRTRLLHGPGMFSWCPWWNGLVWVTGKRHGGCVPCLAQPSLSRGSAADVSHEGRGGGMGVSTSERGEGRRRVCVVLGSG